MDQSERDFGNLSNSQSDIVAWGIILIDHVWSFNLHRFSEIRGWLQCFNSACYSNVLACSGSTPVTLGYHGLSKEHRGFSLKKRRVTSRVTSVEH